jgi:hypothetical protein
VCCEATRDLQGEIGPAENDEEKKDKLNLRKKTFTIRLVENWQNSKKTLT